MKKGLYMGIDQYGTTYHNLTNPRKDLMDRLCRKSARKMYVDGKDGKSYHIGYIVGPYWIDLFEVKRVRIPV